MKWQRSCHPHLFPRLHCECNFQFARTRKMAKIFQPGFLLLLLFHATCFTSAQDENLTVDAVDVGEVDVNSEVTYQQQYTSPPTPPPTTPPLRQVGQLFDSELSNFFLDIQKRMAAVGVPSDATLQKISIPKSNPIFTSSSNDGKEARKKSHHMKHDRFYDFDNLSPDLVGEDVAVRSRQVGKWRQQMGYNGTMDGFKNQGEYLPWMLLTETTPDNQYTTGTGSTEVTPPSRCESPEEPPIESVHVLPLCRVSPDSLYGRCKDTEKNKGNWLCFGYPDGCIEEERCRMAVSLLAVKDSDEVIITMAATAPRGFVALGFSEDRFMGNDTVVHCNNIPKTKWMTMHLAINTEYSNKVQSNHDFLRDFTPLQGYAQDNGVITCEFSMRVTVHPDPPPEDATDAATEAATDATTEAATVTATATVGRRRRRSVEETTSVTSPPPLGIFETTKFLFLAFGRHSEVMDPNSTEFGQLKFHHMVVVSDDEDSEVLGTLLTQGKLLPPRTTLILLHIIPYTLAFSFFIPCAIFIGKYGREAYGNEESCLFGLPHWLAIHISFQNIAVLLSFLGFFGILSELGWVWRTFQFWPMVHCVGGLIATIGLWLNFLLGWAGYCIKTGDNVINESNHEKTKGVDPDADLPEQKTLLHNYKYFKWVHWVIGNLVFWFGMTALVFAHLMKRAWMPCMFYYVVMLQIVVHVLTHIVMMIHTSYLVRILNGLHWRRRVYPGPMIAWKKENIEKKHFPNKETKFSDLPIWCGRRRAIIFYFITAFFCCIGLLGLMAVPTVLCRKALIK